MIIIIYYTNNLIISVINCENNSVLFLIFIRKNLQTWELTFIIGKQQW